MTESKPESIAANEIVLKNIGKIIGGWEDGREDLVVPDDILELLNECRYVAQAAIDKAKGETE